jgi:hypothetical protein
MNAIEYVGGSIPDGQQRRATNPQTDFGKRIVAQPRSSIRQCTQAIALADSRSVAALTADACGSGMPSQVVNPDLPDA